MYPISFISEIHQYVHLRYCFIYTVAPPSHLRFSPWLIESLDAEPMDTESGLHYTVLYKELEHPQILVSTGSWNQSQTDTVRQLYSTAHIVPLDTNMTP